MIAGQILRLGSIQRSVLLQEALAAQVAIGALTVYNGKVYRLVEYQIIFADKLYQIAIEILLEAVQTVQRVIRCQIAGNAAEVIDAALLLQRPLNHHPLQ